MLFKFNANKVKNFIPQKSFLKNDVLIELQTKMMH